MGPIRSSNCSGIRDIHVCKWLGGILSKLHMSGTTYVCMNRVAGKEKERKGQSLEGDIVNSYHEEASKP